MGDANACRGVSRQGHEWMNRAACQTDNSVITMRDGTRHMALVLGRQEGVVGTVENWRAHAL